MTWTGIRIRGTDHLSIFESEEILWNQKSRDESKEAFIGQEIRRDTMVRLVTLKIIQSGKLG